RITGDGLSAGHLHLECSNGTQQVVVPAVQDGCPAATDRTSVRQGVKAEKAPSAESHACMAWDRCVAVSRAFQQRDIDLAIKTARRVVTQDTSSIYLGILVREITPLVEAVEELVAEQGLAFGGVDRTVGPEQIAGPQPEPVGFLAGCQFGGESEIRGHMGVGRPQVLVGELERMYEFPRADRPFVYQ